MMAQLLLQGETWENNPITKVDTTQKFENRKQNTNEEKKNNTWICLWKISRQQGDDRDTYKHQASHSTRQVTHPLFIDVWDRHIY